jgi:hypothetical protein
VPEAAAAPRRARDDDRRDAEHDTGRQDREVRERASANSTPRADAPALVGLGDRLDRTRERAAAARLQLRRELGLGALTDALAGARRTQATQEREPVADRLDRLRGHAAQARMQQRRAASAMSDLRVLDGKLQKVREAARLARLAMQMADEDADGQKSEDLFAGLDDNPPARRPARDALFDVNRSLTRLTDRLRPPKEPAAKLKSVLEQLDERRQSALEKRRQKKKQEGRWR